MPTRQEPLPPHLAAEDIGRRIARSRRERRLSQRTVCRRTGLDPSYLSRLENGRVLPSVSMAMRIAAAMQMSLDELLGPSPPQQHGRMCPVGPSGHCLMDAADSETRRLPAHRRGLSESRIRLLQRFAALVERSDSETVGALNILLRELEKGRRAGA